MARKISSNKLLHSLKDGKLKGAMQYVAENKNDLSLQIRDNYLTVYYRGGNILNIKGKNNFTFDGNYFGKNNPNKQEEMNELLLFYRKEYQKYFDKVKEVVENWEKSKKDRREFVVQQKIATKNQDINGRFIILDMEYGFSQARIPKDDRLSRAKFDLLAIEHNSGKVVFFEVKKGLKALENKSGIKSHINDFEKFLYTDKNKEIYRSNLEIDIMNIVSAKKTLGFLDYSLPDNFSVKEVDFAFIFEPDDDSNVAEIEEYKRIFNNEHKESEGSSKSYSTFCVSPENYILNNPM